MHKSWIILAVASVLATSVPVAFGQLACSCDDVTDTVCNAQGFEITLVSFSVDQDAGTSSWDYKVCNNEGLNGVCVPPRDVAHFDINMPALGDCLTAQQDISLAQVEGFANATLACSISNQDPSCSISGTADVDYLGKCDIAFDTLDSGECVTVRLTIAGEQPTLGAGLSSVVTKAGPDCVADCILGPSCQTCAPEADECLTRTGGFWSTHPHITNLFLPVSVCGEALSVVEAGSCDSVTEALCVAPGRESRGNAAYAQLVRQLAAAKLNLAATAANGGFCGSEIEERIAQCEALCGANQRTISDSGCIEDLEAFNESADSFPLTPPPFDSPGPAIPAECQAARGNGILIGANCQ